MSPLHLSSLFRRDPEKPTLKDRGAALRVGIARVARKGGEPAALPAPGSDEAVAAFEAASREFTRLTPLSSEDYAALRIGDTFTLWTTGWIKAARRGDYSRFSLREFEVARSKTPAELSALLVLTTRRDLQFAEAEHRTNIKTLYALAYPDGEDPEPLPDAEGDHAHVAIAEHREAYADWKPLGDAWNEMPGDPGWKEAQEAQAEPYRVQSEAFQELIDTRASTVAGLVALAGYLPGAVIDANCIDVEEDARRALRSVCNSVLSLFGAEADAALVGLEADYLAADAAYTIATSAMREGRSRCVEPPVPRDLKVWSNDWAYTSIPIPKARHERFHYDEFEVEILRTQPCVATFIGGEGELQPDGVGRVRPDPRAQARADAIVAAWDGWQEQIRQARAAVDLDALEAAWDAATAARDAVLQRVRETTARGLAGLAVKARIAASMAAIDDPKAHALGSFDPADSDGLLYDLAGDVLAATGGLPDAFQAEG
ncbi:hypothetical protein Q8W71_30060 [Methylobacterium sp. NEAU 140]|uniref:hypothetical protein n=1 Tax=Methylobacterium sp. NEAU 140 TaxID=3064945 RepID=UPI002735E9D6|nr:hypothetical protein [Methylobacterium sp. NEAU 140]MDP4026846.1 hypothetical protein [Methylobacterium sp. NEAU 140]